MFRIRMLTLGDSIVICGMYYWVWVHVIPRWGGYTFRQTVLEFPDGAVSHALVKVRNEDLAAWDSSHDVAGKTLVGSISSVAERENGEKV
jgi:hypothetical protein